METVKIFSPWNPEKLKRRIGKHKNIKTNIFIFKLENKKLINKKTIKYQIKFTKAVV